MGINPPAKWCAKKSGEKRVISVIIENRCEAIAAYIYFPPTCPPIVVFILLTVLSPSKEFVHEYPAGLSGIS